MTPPEKPEWITIAETDKAAMPRMVSKKLPALALIITATIIGAGAVFGQTADQNPASAVETLAPAVQSSASSQPDTTKALPSNQGTTSVATSASKEKTVSVTPSVSIQNAVDEVTPQPNAPVTPKVVPATSTIKNPSIGTMPTKGGDDSDDEEDDDEGGDDD